MGENQRTDSKKSDSKKTDSAKNNLSNSSWSRYKERKADAHGTESR